mmetsp:Transcript_37751/g.92561  ORF Transcript_37751/g.92561 Transcript_37751/m.92561 type:complete len:239 (+) Transcript_37751:506-1222(+)
MRPASTANAVLKLHMRRQRSAISMKRPMNCARSDTLSRDTISATTHSDTSLKRSVMAKKCGACSRLMKARCRHSSGGMRVNRSKSINVSSRATSAAVYFVQIAFDARWLKLRGDVTPVPVDERRRTVSVPPPPPNDAPPPPPAAALKYSPCKYATARLARASVPMSTSSALAALTSAVTTLTQCAESRSDERRSSTSVLSASSTRVRTLTCHRRAPSPCCSYSRCSRSSSSSLVMNAV